MFNIKKLPDFMPMGGVEYTSPVIKFVDLECSNRLCEDSWGNGKRSSETFGLADDNERFNEGWED